jgi:hypothetical protein
MYLQINIGRNVNNLAMPDEAWETFQSEAGGALCAFVLDTTGALNLAEAGYSIERHISRGSWEGSSVDEESIHFSVFVPDSELSHVYHSLGALRFELLRQARYWGQDAIALITHSELINS